MSPEVQRLASMYDAPALRSLRGEALIRAACYRRYYLRCGGNGFDQRMWQGALEQAREYRAAEKLRSAQSERKAA